MASRSVAGPSPSRISSRMPSASARISASKSGEARKAVRSPAARAKRPVPTGSARPGTAIGAAARLADVGQRHRLARARRAPRRCARWPRSTGAGRGDAGMADEGAAAPPPALVGIVAAHHHRRAVLAGDRDDAAARIGAAHQVAERRHAQVDGRDGVIFGRAAGDALVLGAIDIFVGARGALVEPVVGDDAGPARAGAGEDGRMAGAGLGRGVRLVAGGEDRCPARQAPEAAGEILAIFGEQVGGELIDRNGDDQPRRGRAAAPAAGAAARASRPARSLSSHSAASSRRPSATKR